jgi:hypothetical protein
MYFFVHYHCINFQIQSHHILKDIKKENSEIIFTFVYLRIFSFVYLLTYDKFELEILYSGRVGNEIHLVSFWIFCDFC